MCERDREIVGDVYTWSTPQRETMAATGGKCRPKKQRQGGGDAPLTDQTTNERTNVRTTTIAGFERKEEGDRPRTYVRTYGRTNDGRCLAGCRVSLATARGSLANQLVDTRWCVPRPSRSSLALPPSRSRHYWFRTLVCLSLSHQPSRAPCTRDVSFDLHQGRLTLPPLGRVDSHPDFSRSNGTFESTVRDWPVARSRHRSGDVSARRLACSSRSRIRYSILYN